MAADWLLEDYSVSACICLCMLLVYKIALLSCVPGRALIFLAVFA